MNRHSEEASRGQRGPEALFSRVGSVTIVHLDHPTESMLRERIAEVQRETKEPVEDCPLCEEMRLAGGHEIAYTGSELPEEN